MTKAILTALIETRCICICMRVCLSRCICVGNWRCHGNEHDRSDDKRSSHRSKFARFLVGQFQHGVARRTSHRVRLRLGPDEATPYVGAESDWQYMMNMINILHLIKSSCEPVTSISISNGCSLHSVKNRGKLRVWIETRPIIYWAMNLHPWHYFPQF